MTFTDLAQKMTTATETPLDNGFQLKGSRISVTVLELYHYDYEGFNRQLAETVKAAPQFFNQMPVVISLEKIQHKGFVDFIEIGQLCQEYGLFPVAVRGGSEDQLIGASVAGLARIPGRAEKAANRPEPSDEAATASSATTPETTSTAKAQDSETANNETTSETHSAPNSLKKNDKPVTDTQAIDESAIPVLTTTPTRMIKQPVRSGQQNYSHGDLIVSSPVSPGAEILAEGNIHVYGALRGRALAGVKGDKSAMIFCQSLEAELVSIAGTYKVNEDLRGALWKKPVKISLVDDQLLIEAL